MADIYSLIQQVIEEGDPMLLARNPTIQFGREGRSYLGATLLPEVLKDQNQYTEEKVVYRTVVANDGTRYSEPQLKHGELVGTFDVKFGELDIARQLTGKDFDNIRAIASDNPEQARGRLIGWLNTAVNLALVEKEEAQRWQAICNAQVPILGTDGKVTTVMMSAPSGHRVTIPSGTTGSPTGWYDTSGNYDPFDDIFAGRDFLAQKGYQIGRIIAPTPLMSAIARNPAVKQRVGITTISGGSLVSRSGSATSAAINAELQAAGLPAIETYDLTYLTQVGSTHFLPRNKFVMVATTLRDEEIDLGDAGTRIVTDVLGYYGVGTAVGEATPGRVIRAESRLLKPVGVYAQGWQTSFPVITEPEAVFVLEVNPPS